LGHFVESGLLHVLVWLGHNQECANAMMALLALIVNHQVVATCLMQCGLSFACNFSGV